MPVLRYSESKGRHYVESPHEGQDTKYRLVSEGVRHLVVDLGIDDDESFAPEVMVRLIQRGWAFPDRSLDDAAPAASPPPSSPSIVVPTIPPPPPFDEPESEAAKSQSRTRGRMVALQVLYQIEQNPGVAQTEIDKFVARRIRDARVREFTRGLVEGVRSNQARIDGLISGVAENWRLDRMAAIDRNILRLGAFELLSSPDVPAKVAINEALELAKRYSTAQSSRFVNGILDRLLAADLAAKEKEAAEAKVETETETKVEAEPSADAKPEEPAAP